MDAVLQHHPVADEMEAEPGPLPLTATVGSGNQIAGTRSRRENSASTQAPILSVLQASGASPFTFCASAISTS